MTKISTWTLLCTLAATISACASTPVSPPLASDREVVEYVTANWPDFTGLATGLATEFAGRDGQPATLVSIVDVDCQPDDDVIFCHFTTRIRFSDGQTASPRLGGNFGRRGDGTLVQLLRVVSSAS